MQLITATVKSQPREVSTKFGQRSVMDVTLPNGQEQAIWGPANFAAIANCYQGQSVAIAVDSKGKYHIVEDKQPATQAQPAKPATMAPETKRAIADYVTEQAKLFGFCLSQASTIQGIQPEDIRPVATTLYLGTVKKFGLQ